MNTNKMSVEQALECIYGCSLVLDADGNDYSAGNLRQALATLRAELDGLRRDAERWRFYRDGTNPHNDAARIDAMGQFGDALDSAIDAAMQESSHEP